MMDNYSAAADKNRQPILEKLQVLFFHTQSVLEIGSGSGQHAIFFTERLPHLTWQTTETAENLQALQNNLSRTHSPQLPPPVLLDVKEGSWPVTAAESLFTANTLHIMPWPVIENMFTGIGQILNMHGLLCIYGAMRYNGAFTSDSNARFDLRLKKQDPLRGIRDFEAVDRLAKMQGMELLVDHAMPSNNQLLVWKRMRGQTP